MDEALALQIFIQILEGMRILHEKKIIHRNIKLENILLKNKQVKLCDFKYCQSLLESEKQDLKGIGVSEYSAPEL